MMLSDVQEFIWISRYPTPYSIRLSVTAPSFTVVSYNHFLGIKLLHQKVAALLQVLQWKEHLFLRFGICYYQNV